MQDSTSLQGDFSDDDAAGRAREAFLDMGIAESRVRKWNIIGDSAAAGDTGGGALRGGFIGGLAGGRAGIAVGAVAGSHLDDGGDNGGLPEPSGVRIVVDIAPDRSDARQIEDTFRASGAVNIGSGAG